jgi:hypothetical protein
MTLRNRTAKLLAVTTLALLAGSATADEETTRAIGTIRSVSKEGKGNDAAGLAWKALVGKGGPALMPTLEAMDDTNPTASNWLRSAVDAIVQAEKDAKRPLPADKLEAMALDTKFAPSARRLAYELLIAQVPDAKPKLLAQFLNDVSPDLRRDAVAAELAKLDKSANPKADLQKLFANARDLDQVEDIAKKLAAHKAEPNVTEHFGFITHWSYVGPFDSTAGKGFTTPYPPETATDAAGKFKGKGDAEVTWKATVAGVGREPMSASKVYAMVDLNKLIGKNKDAVAYLFAVVVAEKETPCELRGGSQNAVQFFLNGKKIFEREEYHAGTTMDQHNGKGTLKAGPNVIVVKVCQNNQPQDWAQVWGAQLRVCDLTGGPIPGLTQLVGDKKEAVKLGFVPPGLIDASEKEEKK